MTIKECECCHCRCASGRSLLARLTQVTVHFLPRNHPPGFYLKHIMKTRLANTLLFMLVLPAMAHAHTETFFPKMFSPAELPTSGFVLLNPDPFTATVYLY